MSATITLAKQFSTGVILHINDVDKKSKELFFCCDCKKDLVAVKSEARKKDWHFRHPSHSNIAKCRSTALHDYAVQLLMNNSEIILSKLLKINYTERQKEVWINDTYRSDVAVTYNGYKLHFEVFVTHDMEQHKSEYYENNKIKCCRIDLSEVSLLSAPPELIQDVVLNQYHNKKLFGWPSPAPPIVRWYERPEYIFPLVIIFIAWLYSRMKSKR